MLGSWIAKLCENIYYMPGISRGKIEKGLYESEAGVYKVNDIVVYGKMGVCEITEITAPKDGGFPRNRLYYILKPLHDSCTIYAPVDSKVHMRPVISADEAEQLIDMIPALIAEAYDDSGTQDLVRHYEAVIDSHDCEAWLKLTMEINAKKQFLESRGRVFGQIDKKYMKQAEELLFGEIAHAVGIPIETVPDFIAARVEQLEQQSA